MAEKKIKVSREKVDKIFGSLLIYTYLCIVKCVELFVSEKNLKSF